MSVEFQPVIGEALVFFLLLTKPQSSPEELDLAAATTFKAAAATSIAATAPAASAAAAPAAPVTAAKPKPSPLPRQALLRPPLPRRLVRMSRHHICCRPSAATSSWAVECREEWRYPPMLAPTSQEVIPLARQQLHHQSVMPGHRPGSGPATPAQPDLMQQQLLQRMPAQSPTPPILYPSAPHRTSRKHRLRGSLVPVDMMFLQRCFAVEET